MATCAHCGTTILFGGVKEGGHRYCGANCAEQGSAYRRAEAQIPDDVVDEQVRKVHQGDCPKCGGVGPVDVHTSHTVWSIIYLTQWTSHPEICCRSCGVKSKLVATLTSGLFGWWGVPFGIIFTPLQIIKNLSGLASSPDPDEPSAELHSVVRTQITSYVAAAALAKKGRGRSKGRDDDEDE